MKLCNIEINGEKRFGLMTERGVVDVNAVFPELSMEKLIAGEGAEQLKKLEKDESLPTVAEFKWLNVVEKPEKLVCVGLNYKAHAIATGHELPEYPVIFNKFPNALAPCGADVVLPPWENSYDYEAELVIVMGKECFGVSEDEAKDFIFGYTCGNDVSCRKAQGRSGQWLIGKTMPGFGPCGPVIVTADSFDPAEGHSVQSYVNGQLRQNGSTDDLIFDCAKMISYISKYTRLMPGDLIFTGTPSGVALEDKSLGWLKAGDRVDVVIDGIGTLTSRMV